MSDLVAWATHSAAWLVTLGLITAKMTLTRKWRQTTGDATLLALRRALALHWKKCASWELGLQVAPLCRCTWTERWMQRCGRCTAATCAWTRE